MLPFIVTKAVGEILASESFTDQQKLEIVCNTAWLGVTQAKELASACIREYLRVQAAGDECVSLVEAALAAACEPDAAIIETADCRITMARIIIAGEIVPPEVVGVMNDMMHWTSAGRVYESPARNALILLKNDSAHRGEIRWGALVERLGEIVGVAKETPAGSLMAKAGAA